VTQNKTNKRACKEMLTFKDEREKAANGNEQIKRFLAKLVLSRSPLILPFSKASASHSVLKMNRVFKDETA